MFRTILISTIAIISFGCATDSVSMRDQFSVNPKEFYSNTKKIAVAPFCVPRRFNQEIIQAKFESLIEEKLKEGDFIIVKTKDYNEIWKDLASQLGGYFDPITGEIDKSKYESVKENFINKLKSEYEVDALLYPSIVTSDVNFEGCVARWDGTKDLVSMPIHNKKYLSGKVSALSLAVAIKDINGNKLYYSKGGVQVLYKIVDNKTMSVPATELFADTEHNKEAVDIALKSLVKNSVCYNQSKEICQTE